MPASPIKNTTLYQLHARKRRQGRQTECIAELLQQPPGERYILCANCDPVWSHFSFQGNWHFGLREFRTRYEPSRSLLKACCRRSVSSECVLARLAQELVLQKQLIYTLCSFEPVWTPDPSQQKKQQYRAYPLGTYALAQNPVHGHAFIRMRPCWAHTLLHVY